VSDYHKFNDSIEANGHIITDLDFGQNSNEEDINIREQIQIETDNPLTKDDQNINLNTFITRKHRRKMHKDENKMEPKIQVQKSPQKFPSKKDSSKKHIFVVQVQDNFEPLIKLIKQDSEHDDYSDYSDYSDETIEASMKMFDQNSLSKGTKMNIIDH
jgi:hypothetical protein